MKWHGKRAGFVISASLIAAVTISLIFVFFLKAELNGKPVIFTYHLESYSQQRYLTVNVDLSDGMNQSESVQVADALFDDCMGQYQHEVRARAKIHYSKLGKPLRHTLIMKDIGETTRTSFFFMNN